MQRLFCPASVIVLLVMGSYESKANCSADTIWINGNVITISKMGDRAQAIGVRNKIIVAIGSNESVRKKMTNNAFVIDLKGRTVVPGFNDAHLHPSPKYPFESVHNIVDLGPSSVKDAKELIDLLKRKAAITPEGLPVRGFGYQDTKLGGHPTKQILDQVSLNHPVIIRHSSGHISVVNSYVLKLAGITKDTRDPPGGSFDRDADGIPNGVCRESALSGFLRSGKLKEASPPTEAEELDAYRKTFEDYLSNGITSVTEAGSSFHKFEIYKTL